MCITCIENEGEDVGKAHECAIEHQGEIRIERNPIDISPLYVLRDQVCGG